MDFKVDNRDLSSVGSFSQKVMYSAIQVIEEAICYSKVRKYFPFLILEPDLRVANYEEKCVIGHTSFIR